MEVMDDLSLLFCTIVVIIAVVYAVLAYLERNKKYSPWKPHHYILIPMFTMEFTEDAKALFFMVLVLGGFAIYVLLRHRKDIGGIVDDFTSDSEA